LAIVWFAVELGKRREFLRLRLDFLGEERQQLRNVAGGSRGDDVQRDLECPAHRHSRDQRVGRAPQVGFGAALPQRIKKGHGRVFPRKISVVWRSLMPEWRGTSSAEMLTVVNLEWSVALANIVSTTFHTSAGTLEADKTYYLNSQQRVLNIKKIDTKTDPPPDFVVQMDKANNSFSKLPAYGALRVPEVWQYGLNGFTAFSFINDAYVEIRNKHESHYCRSASDPNRQTTRAWLRTNISRRDRLTALQGDASSKSRK
jgi:hypothetical protein